MSLRSTMLPYLGRTCRELREERGVKAVHIAVRADKGEASVTRFEVGKTQPDDLDAMVAAYGDALQIAPHEIWRRALEAWQNGAE